MFRKPKKTTKASFRSRKSKQSVIKNIGGNSDIDADDDVINNDRSVASRGKKRFRVNTNDSSSDEASEPSRQEAEALDRCTTSELLQQMKEEKQQQQSSSLSSRYSAKERRKSKARVLHHFDSADPSKELTARDLATRGAEFHPEERVASNRPTQDEVEGDTNDLGVGGPPNEEANGGAKIYKGENTTRNKFLAGPLKAPTFVRTTSRFDYQPDICKDYKDTGFCGFGDTCIYLHDRGDTMSGWQLELEWEEKKKKERERKEAEMEKFARGEAHDDGIIQDQSEGVEDDGLPFGCYLCRGAFKDPIVSRCGHYFCKSCIIQQVRSIGDACPICKKDMQGVFNHPIKLISKKRRLLGSKATWEEFAEAIRKK